jgi:Rod binding domain-containing protein
MEASGTSHDAAGSKQRAQLKKATQQFESMFVANLLKEVRKSMNTGASLFGNSPQARMYADMMDEAVADQMSKTGALGFGSTLYKSLSKYLPTQASGAPGQSTSETGNAGAAAVAGVPAQGNKQSEQAAPAAETAPAASAKPNIRSEKN